MRILSSPSLMSSITLALIGLLMACGAEPQSTQESFRPFEASAVAERIQPTETSGSENVSGGASPLALTPVASVSDRQAPRSPDLSRDLRGKDIPTAERSDAPGRPQLSSISPQQVELRADRPQMLTLVGSGFQRTGNSITLGPVVLSDAQSADGTTLSIQIPVSVSGSGGEPVLRAGEYWVTVSNGAGMSNWKALTVISAHGR